MPFSEVWWGKKFNKNIVYNKMDCNTLRLSYSLSLIKWVYLVYVLCIISTMCVRFWIMCKDLHVHILGWEPSENDILSGHVPAKDFSLPTPHCLNGHMTKHLSFSLYKNIHFWNKKFLLLLLLLLLPLLPLPVLLLFSSSSSSSSFSICNSPLVWFALWNSRCGYSL